MALKSIDEKNIARKIIVNALKIEGSLADILKTESKILKRKAILDTNADDIQIVNRTIKYVIFYLTIIEDRIQRSMDILKK